MLKSVQRFSTDRGCADINRIPWSPWLYSMFPRNFGVILQVLTQKTDMNIFTAVKT